LYNKQIIGLKRFSKFWKEFVRLLDGRMKALEIDAFNNCCWFYNAMMSQVIRKV
jgi:hypothetical protein